MKPSAETLPQLLLAQAERWGNRRVAIREKEFGIWQAYAWRQYADHVQRIALGLASLGFRRGAEKYIFGSDAPRGDFEVEILKIKKATRKDQDLELVLGGNLARLLGLPS
jgi:predicted TIM-barrel fold metal-dependent hydrolase